MFGLTRNGCAYCHNSHTIHDTNWCDRLDICRMGRDLEGPRFKAALIARESHIPAESASDPATLPTRKLLQSLLQDLHDFADHSCNGGTFDIPDWSSIFSDEGQTLLEEFMKVYNYFGARKNFDALIKGAVDWEDDCSGHVWRLDFFDLIVRHHKKETSGRARRGLSCGTIDQ